MTERTKLEKLVFSHPAWIKAAQADKKTKQMILDDIILFSVMPNMDPADLCESTAAVYGDTVEEYRKNPHTKHVIDDLVRFMGMLPEGALVLDIGCAYGRDSLFMALKDEGFRRSFMGRIKDGKNTVERYGVPLKSFRTVGLDASPLMVDMARKYANHFKCLRTQADGYPYYLCRDMHSIEISDGSGPILFDGLWSCTALFTHTPQDRLEEAMESAVNALKPGGIFFVSYTNGRVGGAYDKLILSSTGRIKWFSQPDPDELIILAQKYGLEPIEESSFDDYAKGADFAKDLFVSHFFRKLS